jgi:transcriptional regulator with XRE-family HTH domain
MGDYLKAVGTNIKHARVAAHMRQVDVTEGIGINYRHYQDIEAGNVNVSLLTLCRLAKLFGTSISMLIKGC